jgi:CBS-domain-containing membrane protein
MSSTQERAVSVAAAVSSAGQWGSGVQRRQLALERYVAAIAGDKPSHQHAAAPNKKLPNAATNAATAAEPTVSSVMTDAISLPTTAGFADVLRALAANAVTAIPVVDHDGVPVGVVSEADLLVHAVADDGQAHSHWHRAARAVHHRPPAELTAGDLMSSPAITTTPEASITQAATIAAHAHVKVLPVVDAYGRVVGMLSRAALLGAYLAKAE